MFGMPMARASRMVAALVVIVAVSNACTKKESASTDSASVPDTTAGAAILAQSNPGWPTDGKNSEWVEYVTKKLDFNISFADLDSTAVITYTCKQGDDCSTTDGKVRFLVVPEKHAFNVNWAFALTPSNNKKGYVTAAYWNMDRIAVPSLKLPANTNMYEWVGPISDSTYGIQLFSISESGVQIAASGTPTDYEFCEDNAPRTKSAVKMKPAHACPNRAGVQTKKSAVMLTERFPEDLWLSCAGGCCQSSLTQIN